MPPREPSVFGATMTAEHGHCPACRVSLDGGGIWQHFRDRETTKGASPEAAEAEADRCAEMYGATRARGQWGRQIGLYSTEHDRTVAYQCPDCGHQWDRP